MRILALDIGGTAIKIGLINKNGEIIEKREVPTLAKAGGEALMEKIINIIGEYENIDRIGISTAGQVDPLKVKLFLQQTISLVGLGWKLKKELKKDTRYLLL